MKLRRNNIYVSLFFWVCVVITLAFLSYLKHANIFFNSNANHIINLTKDGFYPPDIVIRQGDMVTFTTNYDQDFWPASDLHPDHGVYPEFDPMKPISSDKSWSFVFDKVGVWNYHNHLLSAERGKINVVEKGGSLLNSQLLDCQKNANIEECWDHQIISILDTGGITKAFNKIQELYITEPQFAPICHGMVHNVGSKAYKLFENKENFELPASVSDCSFGFYHGFMQELVHRSNDPQKAKEFCEYADKQLGKISSGTLGTCYHGMGHGAVEDYDGKWKNEDSLVQPALRFCEKVSGDNRLLNRCASGVFNAMAIAYNSNKLDIDKTDPLWYCRGFEKDYAKLSCFQEMNTSLMMLAENNFKLASKYLVDISDDAHAISAMESLSAVNGQLGIKKEDFTDIIKVCRSLEARVRLACIKGYVSGLIQVGPPNLEYVKLLQYCKTKGLSSEESSACYEELIWQTSNIYPPDKQREICAMVDQRYNKKCTE